MHQSISRGCRARGTLPGFLKVPRRAQRPHRDLMEVHNPQDPLRILDWVSLFAIAVNEENAAGGRVVTAPTNRSEEHTSELQSLMRISYAVFCLKQKHKPPDVIT